MLVGVWELRRAADRFVTRSEGLESRHSFSFGAHYDPTNVGHAVLVAHNDDVVQPGSGYPEHPHRDMEIVTWVLEGSLVHQDSTGRAGVVHPGLAQRMSAGSGVVHAETNDAWRLGEPRRARPLRFVQMWVLPDEPGLEPSYQQQDVSADLRSGLVTVASGMPRHRDVAATRIHNTGAALHALRLAAGDSATLPDAPHLHLFVARGTVVLEAAGELAEGDAARFTGEGGHRLAGRGAGAEVLVWEMHGTATARRAPAGPAARRGRSPAAT